MRLRLLQEERDHQFQLEYLSRRSDLAVAFNILLLICFLLAVSLAWSLWRINIARRQEALEDPLTGLKNRRFLVPFMDHETERLRRSGYASLILLVDIDLFKTVNDRFGHEVGDEALVQLSEGLRHCVRNSVVITRWGGEEFVIVCTQSSKAQAEVICNRIRHYLQRTPMRSRDGSTFHLTVSIGATLFSPVICDEHWEDALARADRALYSVKDNGRDNWLLAPIVPDNIKRNLAIR